LLTDGHDVPPRIPKQKTIQSPPGAPLEQRAQVRRDDELLESDDD
jgi:hypothetical protein